MKQKLCDASESNLLGELNSKISKNLLHLISELNSKKKFCELKLGAYSPLKYEPIWWEGFDPKLVNEFLLVHMHEEINLSYHQVEFDEITSSHHGLELDEGLIFEEKVPDVVLVPGIAFTESGERLGRGKAYFDNYLKHFKGIKIGVFYSFQEVSDVFTEEHDEVLMQAWKFLGWDWLWT